MYVCTYLESYLCNLKLYLLKCFHVFVFNELVPIHSAGLMEPQANSVHGCLDCVGGGKEDTLGEDGHRV